MPTVLHPRALAETDGSAPHRVVIERQRFVVDTDTGLVDLESEQQAQALAEAHGVDRDAIDPDSGQGESAGSGESDENGADGPSGGATDETTHRTNDDGEPLCAGTTGAGDPCTRTVDEPGGYCYQHED